MKPQIIKGGSHTDNRGTIRFVNDFDLKDIRRFYTIQHPDTQIIRAWQGHKIETKYFMPLSGTFVVAWVEIDDFEDPSDQLKAEYTILNAKKPKILHIPPGHANGLRAMESNSQIAVFSDMPMEKSSKEKYSYPPEKWLNWFSL